MFAVKTPVIIAISLLAACSSSGSAPAEPPKPEELTLQFGIATPGDDGSISAGFAEDGQHVTGTQSGAVSGGYTYQMGVTEAGNFTAIAGILSGTTFTAPPASGSITYDATYHVKSLENIKEIDGELHALGGVGVHGDITLTADFDSASFEGSAATDTPSGISMNGTINSAAISGTVTFRGMEGELAGVAGSDQVVGAFAGSGETGVFAGGLTGAPMD